MKVVHPLSDKRAGRRRRRWRARTIVLLMFLGAVTAVVGLGLGVTCRPGWYHPGAIDWNQLRTDKRDLVSLLDQIGAALNAGRAVRIELDEAQVNRWIAARAEMWPDAVFNFGPCTDPQIALRAGVVRVGSLVTHRGVSVVASMSVRVAVSEEHVVLACESARAGLVPVPTHLAASVLSQIDRLGALHIASGGETTLELPNDWRWPNGRRRCRIRELAITDGRAVIILEPWPR